MSTPLRARWLAAALLVLGAPLWAEPADVPQLDLPVAPKQAQTQAQAHAPLAPAAAVPAALAAAAPGLSPFLPAAVVPSAALLPQAPRVGPAAFQNELSLAREGARQADVLAGRGDAEGARQASSALFDLAAAPQDGSVSAAGLPSNAAGQTLLQLRRAGQAALGIPGLVSARWLSAAGHGYSGETSRILVDGRVWYLKRLGKSPDPEIDATPPQTRALNEAGLASVLRRDPQLSRSFSVPARVSVFRDGLAVYVLSEGLPSAGDGESGRRNLAPEQRADASLIQLVLGLGDMHGGDVLPLEGGGFGLVDFEKLSRSPLAKAALRQVDDEVLLKEFPLVDRLADNDPAVYRARFEAWRRDYESGGRERMDQALAEAGWSKPSRDAYLSAVDRNLETYWDRLAPYLDYANEWHRRIERSRAEARAKAAQPRSGWLDRLFGSGAR